MPDNKKHVESYKDARKALRRMSSEIAEDRLDDSLRVPFRLLELHLSEKAYSRGDSDCAKQHLWRAFWGPDDDGLFDQDVVLPDSSEGDSDET